MTIPDEWVQAAQAADQEYAKLPLSQRECRSWQRVPDRQVRRLLEAALPLIAAPYVAALARHQQKITDSKGTICAGCLCDWPCPDLVTVPPEAVAAAAWRGGYGQGRDDEAAGLPLRGAP